MKHINDIVINVQVHEGTTTAGLKHIIQDETGIPVEDQILEYDGIQIIEDKKRVVEICIHKKHIVLKSRKFNWWCTLAYT